MNVQLSLDTSLSTHEKKEKIKNIKSKKEEANKTISERISDIENLNYNGKDKQYFDIAKEALLKNESIRKKDGKLTKTEMISLGKEIAESKKDSERASKIKQVLENKPSNFFILTKNNQLTYFKKRLREECFKQQKEWKDRWKELGVQSLIAWDVEGTGIDSYIDLSIGFSIWLPMLNEGYYLPYGHVYGIDKVGKLEIPKEYQFKKTDSQLTRSVVLEAVKPYLTCATHGKSYHMGAPRYDLHMAMNDGFEIKGCVWDSRDAMYLMNEHEDSYGLKPLTKKYGKFFGITDEVFTFEDLFSDCSPAPFNVEVVGIYAIKDVYYGWKLTEWQFEMMKKKDNLFKCYSLIDSKLPETDMILQRTGFQLDFEKLKELENEFLPRLEAAHKSLYKAYNIDDEFTKKMYLKINKKKIDDWIQKQKVRIEKHKEKIKKYESEISEIENQGKTHLKKYIQLKEKLKNAIEKTPIEAVPENSPFIEDEFSFTSNRHLAYLIYDVLGITDITPSIKFGKVRAVSKDILKKYFEKEEALKPLAEVSELEKLLNTYVQKLPEALEIDSNLHSMFDSTGTSTGRYASKGYKGRPVSLYRELIEKFGSVEN